MAPVKSVQTKCTRPVVHPINGTSNLKTWSRIPIFDMIHVVNGIHRNIKGSVYETAVITEDNKKWDTLTIITALLKVCDCWQVQWKLSILQFTPCSKHILKMKISAKKWFPGKHQSLLVQKLGAWNSAVTIVEDSITIHNPETYSPTSM